MISLAFIGLTSILLQQIGIPTLRLRSQIAPVEVKVQGVVQTSPTPSGAITTVTLDILQPTELGTGLSEMLITSLVQNDIFEVSDDIQNSVPYIIKSAVTELKVARSTTGSQGQIAKVLDFSKGETSAFVAVDMRIVDLATGTVKFSVRGEGKAVSKGQSITLKQGDLRIGNTLFEQSPLGRAVREAMLSCVKQLADRVKKIPWEALVADVDLEDEKTTIYINAGRQSGLKVGDLISLRETGTPIVDPVTSKILGNKPGKILGSFTVETVEDSLSTASVKRSISAKRGDHVFFINRPGGK